MVFPRAARQRALSVLLCLTLALFSCFLSVFPSCLSVARTSRGGCRLLLLLSSPLRVCIFCGQRRLLPRDRATCLCMCVCVCVSVRLCVCVFVMLTCEILRVPVVRPHYTVLHPCNYVCVCLCCMSRSPAFSFISFPLFLTLPRAAACCRGRDSPRPHLHTHAHATSRPPSRPAHLASPCLLGSSLLRHPLLPPPMYPNPN